jgi:hypothetical protein
MHLKNYSPFVTHVPLRLFQRNLKYQPVLGSVLPHLLLLILSFHPISRECIQRYTTIFAHHFCQEFHKFLSPFSTVIQSLGTEGLLSCITFLQSIEQFRQFQFIPRTFFTHFYDNLLSVEKLIREYLHLIGEQVNKWSADLKELQPRHRGHKLTEFQKIIQESIDTIQIKYAEEYQNFPLDVNQQTFLIITIETIAMTAAKHIEAIQFVEYGEDALLSHILACHDCIRYFTSIRISSRRAIERVCEDGSARSTQSSPGSDEDAKGNSNWTLTLSRTSVEQLGRIFLQSGTTAAIIAVQNMASTTRDLVAQFFFENSSDPKSLWITGQLVQNYLSRVTQWMEQICARGSRTPNEFYRIIHREVIRLVVSTYISTLISRYRLNKRFKLSEIGETRVATDLKEIHQWVLQQNEALIPSNVQDKGSYTGSNDILMLIRILRMFMTSDESNLLICFIESIQQFGLLSAPHLYDIARLAFKIRSDLTSKQREYILSGFALFLNELSSRTTSDDFCPLSNNHHPRLSGPEILSELCPEVGSYHCTGKKWSYETTIDPLTRNEILQLVNEAVHVAQIRRSGMIETNSLLTSPPRYTSMLTPSNTATLDHTSLDMLLRNPLNDHTSSRTSSGDGIESAAVTLAIDNISFLDNELFQSTVTTTTTSHPKRHSLQSLHSLSQPLIDLDHSTFDQLHLKLRPYFYGDETWSKPQFTNYNSSSPRNRNSPPLDQDQSHGETKEGSNGSKSRSSSSSSEEFIGFDGEFQSSPDG